MALLQPQTDVQPSAMHLASDTPLLETSLSLMTGNLHHFSYVNNPSTNWIIDTGATNHMVHSQSSLTHAISVAFHSVKLPNGQSVPVSHMAM